MKLLVYDSIDYRLTILDTGCPVKFFSHNFGRRNPILIDFHRNQRTKYYQFVNAITHVAPIAPTVL